MHIVNRPCSCQPPYSCETLQLVYYRTGSSVEWPPIGGKPCICIVVDMQKRLCMRYVQYWLQQCIRSTSTGTSTVLNAHSRCACIADQQQVKLEWTKLYEQHHMSSTAASSLQRRTVYAVDQQAIQR